MAPIKTPIPIVKVDYTKKAWEQTTTALHNRWHPDIPVVHAPPASSELSQTDRLHFTLPALMY